METLYYVGMHNQNKSFQSLLQTICFIAAIFVDTSEKAHSAIAGHYHLPGMGADIRKWVSWYLQSNEVEYFTFNNSSLV